jgi:peptidoglycan/xylan/chitin deacetylase (PgdA/CDA1 family)
MSDSGVVLSGVVLSGDVHHTIPAADQAYTHSSEAALAISYAQIAARHGLKTTQFVTGRAVVEFESEVRALAALENVALGGHGWDAFQPDLRYRIIHRASGSVHGPRAYQRRAVRRTRRALERTTDRPVDTWRNHAYTHDANTPSVLAAEGVVAWSDVVDATSTHPYRHAAGLVVLPINTTPDHERMFHGGQTPATAGDRLYTVDEWCDRVIAEVESIVGAGGVATILAHPICMQVADDWRAFERLCAHLGRFRSLWAHEVGEMPVEAPTYPT